MRKAKTLNVTPSQIAYIWSSWTPSQRFMFVELLQAALEAHDAGKPEAEVIDIMKQRYDAILTSIGVDSKAVKS